MGEAQMLQGELRRWPSLACWAGTPVGLAVAAERLGSFGTSWASEHGARLDPGSVLGPWGKAELEPDPSSRVHIWPGPPTALNVGDRGPRPVPGRLAGGRGKEEEGRENDQEGPKMIPAERNQRSPKLSALPRVDWKTQLCYFGNSP